ncbi:LysR family transcriptional regulator [Chelatococcus sp. SYSU_G07232]|uniref:LysR family transcriptional regulator n=1 Tax=Chelatococcus albus TaxID=3047466 RepID=A0ABT7AN50_9HYPH|nr:LysR family transcriptional regulator [Chelatococcus sp. SYSU_G07232]MDJ1160239.1 LysR family transcriptional regulator [Chelatococcus sp. SYSU_G07232]
MELKWLEDFISLANTLSFSRSAEERHVTQSAFSRRIKQLETWIGVPLVDRATYPARLTPAGEAFLPTAQQIARDLHAARSDARERQGIKANTLSFAALHTLSLTFFPRWLHDVERRVGAVRTRLSTDYSSMEAFITSLTEGESDFLLVYAHPAVPVRLDGQRFAHRTLGRERIVPVSAPGPDGGPLHGPGAAGGPVRYLAYAAGAFLGHVTASLFEERPIGCATVYENTMSEGLKAMAVEGWGLAWIPESILADDLAAGRLVRAADPSWDLTVDIRLYRSLANDRPIVARFWSALAD